MLFYPVLACTSILFGISVSQPTNYDEQDSATPLSEAEAIDLVKTVFASATERDIYTVILFHFLYNISLFWLSIYVDSNSEILFYWQGDKLEIVILNADGIRREYMDLRKD